MDNLTLAIKNFNDKVKLLNNTNQKQLVLTATEARNLNSDIQNLLAYCVHLGSQGARKNTQEPLIEVTLDGGKF
jgi:hypothetical protein